MTDAVKNESRRLAWMLNQILDQPEVHDAMLVSEDGLLRACSEGMNEAAADRVAAALSGVRSTSGATAEFCRSRPDSWQQSLMEFGDGYVIMISAADGTYLAVATSRDADIAVVATTMYTVVGQLGQEMVSAPRQEDGSST
ncbi:roadblock/LC7 domain-containing protein [Streptomyces sp. RKAG337]|uniref:roadblock/LC7 domain-containing protein n=1 Tax=Streptomyces sp. RKAG337 TaxID=2893404 RepID=UPI00203350A1|nr:roadblock/LC7 domain-containing protein [Streptomyces sp. RKAG337]MCM2431024.1 roadblock/LC7 domain-containing protein [Streptomyces sp. RKAG337]